MTTPNTPVFVITLARAAERRRRMLDHLADRGIKARIVDAVDGKLLPAEEKARLVAPGVTIHDGAIGCYLSHLHVYEAMVAESIPVALVLEDDARVSPQLMSLLKTGIEGVGFDYCFLDSDDHNDRGNIYFDRSDATLIGSGLQAYRLSAGPQTTHAYLISLAAASQRLAAAYPIRKAIDLYDHLPYPIVFRAVVEPKLAWVGVDSLESFTSDRNVAASSLKFASLRKSLLFYRIRDLVTLKGFRRKLSIAKLVRKGELAAGRKWAPLPSGREIVL